MTAQEKVEEKLKESFKNICSRLVENTELQKMCQTCEAYCGTKHDYSECKEKSCFRFFLAYNYLQWETTWESE